MRRSLFLYYVKISLRPILLEPWFINIIVFIIIIACVAPSFSRETTVE